MVFKKIAISIFLICIPIFLFSYCTHLIKADGYDFNRGYVYQLYKAFQGIKLDGIYEFRHLISNFRSAYDKFLVDLAYLKWYDYLTMVKVFKAYFNFAVNVFKLPADFIKALLADVLNVLRTVINFLF